MYQFKKEMVMLIIYKVLILSLLLFVPIGIGILQYLNSLNPLDTTLAYLIGFMVGWLLYSEFNPTNKN